MNYNQATQRNTIKPNGTATGSNGLFDAPFSGASFVVFTVQPL